MDFFDRFLCNVISFIVIEFFVLLWVFLPEIASDHGKLVAERSLKLNKDICETNSKYWESKCITVIVEGIEYKGVIIVRSGDKIGLLTNGGALSFTMDKNFSYFNPMANPHD
ncbi:hypothetical protein C1N32_19835 [Vibrio diazotrophicus]|uniref:Uncharacterized protein n=1 Tax=Vibrio diazotrophicus TaxID=685 RepID=A0A2J8HU12_VIBDI|nr:hypothetical protein C1N32_19835 [Vibrio diazotrophicus]